MRIFFDKVITTNYRSCKRCDFKPYETLNVLIGPNGSGKTTLLRSILLLKKLVNEDRVSFHGRTIDAEEHQATTVKVWLKIDGKTIIHTIDFVINTDENNEDEIVASSQKWYMKDITGTKSTFKMPITMANEFGMDYGYIKADARQFYIPKRFLYNVSFHYLKNEKVMRTIATVSKFYQNITYYSASQFTNPSKCPVSFETDEKMRPIRIGKLVEGHGKWLWDMYAQYKRGDGGGPQKLDKVLSYMSDS